LPFRAIEPDGPARRHDETQFVARRFGETLPRVLDFLGYTIDDVVNDSRKREHVRRACKLSFRIARDLEEEPWRTEATARLGEVIARRLREMAGPGA
jgi:hypothetical protein